MPKKYREIVGTLLGDLKSHLKLLLFQARVTSKVTCVSMSQLFLLFFLGYQGLITFLTVNVSLGGL